ncbi:MAG: hypothetical protein OEW06_01655 [Gemmatimonadota bacterium]|nr:hypothetical protein [Gemmatimonadota bacterium]
MPEPAPDLLFVCITAFAAVFVLLGSLALVMRGLIAAFPAPLPASSSFDPAMLAAITTAAAAAFPDATITKIEEAP